MAHKHSVYDTDPHFSINPITRAIKNESSSKVMLIQGDHNSERFTFDMPRMIEEHDMLQCDKVKVHFINTGKTGTTEDAHDVDDFQVSPDGEDTVIFSWLISGHATKHVGPLQFAIEFQCTTDGAVDYAWHTAVFAGISIATGINNGEAIAEEYSDILEQWRERLFENINISPDTIKEAVNEYLAANPVQAVEVDATLTKTGAAADAAAVGEALENKIGQDELQGAINDALTQAKESGDFDGDPGEAATLEIIGADSLPYDEEPTVTEVVGSTAQARRYRLGIPAGKPGTSDGSGSGGGAGIDDGAVSDSTTYSSQKIEKELAELVTGIHRVESLDTETPGGLVNLRDLETGLYVLYGYFSPYANSDMSTTFDNTMVVVSRKTAGSHLLVFTGLNSKVNFLEILVDESQPGGHTYTRTDFVLLDMHNAVEKIGALDGLSTDDKSTLVAAINELHNIKLSAEALPSAVNNALAQAKESGDFDGEPGAPGATFLPAVSSDGWISWSNDAGYENPTSVNIKGPVGPQGEPGPNDPLIIYPVGSVYISRYNDDDHHPAYRFGGIWTPIEDVFLIGASENYPVTANAKDGGVATVTLTESQMPKHKHGANFTNASGATTSTVNVRALEEGSFRTIQSGNKYSSNSALFTETGGNSAHENMPPYKAYYMWERTG